MQSQVSSTKKAIIVVLSVVLIAALFVPYGLIPSMDRKSQAIRLNDRAKKSQREMDTLLTKIEKTKEEAREAEVIIDEYKSSLMVYEAMEDIEEDFTKTLLDKNLSPISIKVTREATTDNNPFEKFSVNINVSGTLQGLISMCGYISREKSYSLTELKIHEEQNSYKAVMVVSAVYVKEGETP